MARENNEAFVQRLMTTNPAGALAQAFIIEAISRYAKQVDEAPPIEGGIVSEEAWKRCAQHIDAEIEKRFGKGRTAA